MAPRYGELFYLLVFFQVWGEIFILNYESFLFIMAPRHWGVILFIGILPGMGGGIYLESCP